ncbi:hypothetical protein HK105_200639 [Polyrhizophydium stewartii]|uniref:BD-FAE-like domain-containing protein n=1 Tax=Polyrhizophydium stewartii TaxID=2732419 RepID=A0ABR4NJS2_9FUNG
MPVTTVAYDGEAHPDRALDVYLPAAAAGGSGVVAVFVHGGAWVAGHRSGYAFMGEALAALGVPTVVAGYRLTPKTVAEGSAAPPMQHPMHLRDVAAAVEWAASDAAAGVLGFAARSLVLVGHSAGAHMVSLLALQAQWLSPRARGLVARVVGLEGIYSLPALIAVFPGYVDWFIARTFGVADSATAAADPDAAAARHAVLRDASPQHVALEQREQLAPGIAFVVVHTAADELVDMAQATQFAARLCADGLPVTEWYDAEGGHDEILKSPAVQAHIASVCRALP